MALSQNHYCAVASDFDFLRSILLRRPVFPFVLTDFFATNHRIRMAASNQQGKLSCHYLTLPAGALATRPTKMAHKYQPSSAAHPP